MTTDLKTIWIECEAIGYGDFEGNLSEVEELMNDGWELVAWNPVAIPPSIGGDPTTENEPTGYDVFLLRRTRPNSD